MVHACFDPAQAAAFNKLSAQHDSTFQLYYFDFHGFAGVCRLVLAASGAHFTNEVPGDLWATKKPETPFGLMPILKETSADGKTSLKVAESDAIERYLAKKFGMLGQDTFEETVVNSFASNTQGALLHFFTMYGIVKDPEQRAENKKTLLTGALGSWVKTHEQHLQANGSNGHYLGNKLSLADIKSAFLLRIIQYIFGEDLISETKTPALWKIRSNFENIPSVKAFLSSEQFKDFSKRNLEGIGFP
ncbi:hypothetical protein EDD11_004310 [Mortierella claussenii]|nr:hypothetical protein EDD11_004310 [Mortierella claussenii]